MMFPTEPQARVSRYAGGTGDVWITETYAPILPPPEQKPEHHPDNQSKPDVES